MHPDLTLRLAAERQADLQRSIHAAGRDTRAHGPRRRTLRRLLRVPRPGAAGASYVERATGARSGT